MSVTPPPSSPGLPVPPATPSAGRPSIWQALVLFLAFGALAGGSCAAFLQRPSGGSANLWTALFLLSVPLAAGAFTLLAFRLVRRRAGEAWPSVAQATLLMLAGAVLAAGGCGGWAVTMDSSFLVPVAVVLFVAFIVGLAIATGGVELFVVAIGRLIFKRPGAR
jgi:hypothetical protein